MTLPLGLLVEAERAAPGLAMPDQDLSRPFRDPAAPGTGCAAATRGARAFVVLVPAAAAILLALALVAVPADAPRPGWATWVVALLSAVAFWGIAHSAATAALGPLWRPGAAAAATATGPATGLDVAILVPMYGEPAAATIGRAVALLARLGRDSDGGHRFSLHILSDTRDDRLATFERAVVRALRQAHPGLAIGYRRRPENRDYKSGNLRDWIQQAGNRHDAALLLDADSVLSAGSARALADALSADPGAALIQAVPRVLAGRTLWQRLQSFASEVYGRNIGRGFALWTGAEANFFGHNAIIRLAAFAAAAGLPHLPGARPRGGVILSHDFVEAALLRRAGWGVRILPEAARTFEEAPPTLPPISAATAAGARATSSTSGSSPRPGCTRCRGSICCRALSATSTRRSGSCSSCFLRPPGRGWHPQAGRRC